MVVNGSYKRFYGSLNWELRFIFPESLRTVRVDFVDKNSGLERSFEVSSLEDLIRLLRDYAKEIGISVFDRRLVSWVEDYFADYGVSIDTGSLLPVIKDFSQTFDFRRHEIRKHKHGPPQPEPNAGEETHQKDSTVEDQPTPSPETIQTVEPHTTELAQLSLEPVVVKRELEGSLADLIAELLDEITPPDIPLAEQKTSYQMRGRLQSQSNQNQFKPSEESGKSKLDYELSFDSPVQDLSLEDIIPNTFSPNSVTALVEVSGKPVRNLSPIKLSQEGKTTVVRWQVDQVRPHEKVVMSYQLGRRSTRVSFYQQDNLVEEKTSYHTISATEDAQFTINALSLNMSFTPANLMVFDFLPGDVKVLSIRHNQEMRPVIFERGYYFQQLYKWEHGAVEYGQRLVTDYFVSFRPVLWVGSGEVAKDRSTITLGRIIEPLFPENRYVLTYTFAARQLDQVGSVTVVQPIPPDFAIHESRPTKGVSWTLSMDSSGQNSLLATIKPKFLPEKSISAVVSGLEQSLDPEQPLEITIDTQKPIQLRSTFVGISDETTELPRSHLYLTQGGHYSLVEFSLADSITPTEGSSPMTGETVLDTTSTGKEVKIVCVSADDTPVGEDMVRSMWQRMFDQLGARWTPMIQLVAVDEDEFEEISSFGQWLDESGLSGHLFLLVDLKKLGGARSKITQLEFEGRHIAIPIYDLDEEFFTEESLAIAVMRDFATFLRSKVEGTAEVVHNGPCILDSPDESSFSDLSMMEAIRAVKKARYQNRKLQLCSNCSHQLLNGLQRLFS